MSDKENKSKVFVIIISVMVILLIVIGSVLTWKIVQKGQEDSLSVYETEQVYVYGYPSNSNFSQIVI